MKPKIAIIIVGLTRTFEKVVESFRNHVLDFFSSEYDIDLFLLTWNITGNIVKDKTLYHTYQSNLEWVDTEEYLTSDQINRLKNYYPNIRTFRIINYQTWKDEYQPQINEFIQTFGLEDHQQVITNTFFGQYYAIQEAFKDFQSYMSQTQQKYEFVIKTRFDLIYQPSQHELSSQQIIKQISNSINHKNQIISLKNWDPEGIEDKFLIGSSENMIKYSQLFSWLSQQFTQSHLNKIHLITFYLPDVYMHFDPNKINDMKQIKEEIHLNMESYYQSNGTYFYPIIPERLLLYYLQNIQSIDVYWEEIFNVAIYRSSGEIKTNEAILKRFHKN